MSAFASASTPAFASFSASSPAPTPECVAASGVQIFVKSLSGKTIVLCVALGESVDVVKAMLESKTKTPSASQRLIFAGKQLEDGHTLAEYNVQRDATLHLVSRLRAGVKTRVELQDVDAASPLAHAPASVLASASASALASASTSASPIVKRANAMEHAWKAWKLMAQNNRVAEEIFMDDFPITVVPRAQTQTTKRNRRRVRHVLSEQQIFEQLCQAFSLLSLPWCEIHTRRGKLLPSFSTSNVKACEDKCKKKPKKTQADDNVSNTTVVKKKWRSARSPFADVTRKKRGTQQAVVHEMNETDMVLSQCYEEQRMVPFST